MSGHDPLKHFVKKFDEFAASARSGAGPAVQAKLLGLLSQYRLKLPLDMYQARLVQAGVVLSSIGAHAAALSDCFAPTLSTAAAGGLAATGLDALCLRVQAELGSIDCSFALLLRRDPHVQHEASTVTMRDLLKRVRESMGACVKHEKLYWLVLNGTRLAYRLCTPLMRPERAADAIETLAWCALCMEGMLPLLSARFISWRVQLYGALCHCYEAAGMLESAAKAIKHALARHEWLKKLDRHDPVPPTAEADAMYRSAERTLGALDFKYSACVAPAPESEPTPDPPAKDKGKKGAPPPPEDEPSAGGVSIRGVALAEKFGEESALQLTAILEALSDYSTDPRPLANAPPADERAELVRELFAGAMQLASPHLGAMDAHEGAMAATKRAKEATDQARGAADAATAEAAQTAEAPIAPEGDTAAEPADDPAAKASAAAEAVAAAEALAQEADAAESAAADAADAAASALPLSVHVALLRAACRNNMWAEVDAIIPSAKARVDQALRVPPDTSVGIATLPIAGAPPAPGVVTAANTVSFTAANTALTFAQDGATLSVTEAGEVGGAAPIAAIAGGLLSDVAKMWIDVSVLAACRAIDTVTLPSRTLPIQA